MNWFNETEDWGARSKGAWIFAMRGILGMILIIKGYLFMFNMNDLIQLIEAYHMKTFNIIIGQIIVYVHLAGGLFILAGIATRLSCLVQFPILVGAVFFTNLEEHAITSSEWMLSVITLFLIIYFFVHGAGNFSVYNLLVKNANPEIEGDENVKNAW